MKIRLKNGLPLIRTSVIYEDRQLILENVLLDTGSGGTVLSTDKVLEIGLRYEPDDTIYQIRGIGGAEFVFAKQVDRLAVDELALTDFEVEVGAMDYGFDLDGIIGTDFLTRIGAIIDLARLEVYQGSSSDAMTLTP